MRCHGLTGGPVSRDAPALEEASASETSEKGRTSPPLFLLPPHALQKSLNFICLCRVFGVRSDAMVAPFAGTNCAAEWRQIVPFVLEANDHMRLAHDSAPLAKRIDHG
jgi:hypothetical protein